MKRRLLLKSLGASAVAAPWLLRNANAAQTRAGQQGSETAELLFVQTAHAVELKDGVLRLSSINPATIFFSDRPQRIVGHEPTEDFVAEWAVGENSFASDPPNAALSILTGTEPQEIILELMNPRMEGYDLLYDVKILQGNEKATGETVSLFIDPVGKRDDHDKDVEMPQSTDVEQGRRDFLKGSVAAAGAGLAASTVPGLAAAAAAESDAKAAADGMTRLKNVIARPDLWFYPGEELDPDEMRITLMGTGWGNIIRHEQKGASIFVELGNGESFVFDVGPGSGINYNTMQVPASRMTKIFLTHLHTDHTSDLAWIYSFGPAGDRYTPLEVFGPTGTKPEFGTKAKNSAQKPTSRESRH